MVDCTYYAHTVTAYPLHTMYCEWLSVSKKKMLCYAMVHSFVASYIQALLTDMKCIQTDSTSATETRAE